jgi:hypothetical protein
MQVLYPVPHPCKIEVPLRPRCQGDFRRTGCRAIYTKKPMSCSHFVCQSSSKINSAPEEILSPLKFRGTLRHALTRYFKKPKFHHGKFPNICCRSPPKGTPFKPSFFMPAFHFYKPSSRRPVHVQHRYFETFIIASEPEITHRFDVLTISAYGGAVV